MWPSLKTRLHQQTLGPMLDFIQSFRHLIDPSLKLYEGSKSRFSTAVALVSMSFRIAAILLKSKAIARSVDNCICCYQIWPSSVHSTLETRAGVFKKLFEVRRQQRAEMPGLKRQQ